MTNQIKNGTTFKSTTSNLKFRVMSVYLQQNPVTEQWGANLVLQNLVEPFSTFEETWDCLSHMLEIGTLQIEK